MLKGENIRATSNTTPKGLLGPFEVDQYGVVPPRS